jgi:hypothetical protein
MLNFARPLLSSTALQPSDGRFRMPPAHARLAEALRLRSELAPWYDEASSWAMPGRACINRKPSLQEDVYDDTAVIATPEFASRIQQGIIPNFAEWTGFIAGILIDDEAERKELSDALEPVNRYLFKMLNASNFSSEANEGFMDLALGTMATRMDPQAGPVPFSTRYIPVGSLAFGIGPDGAPDPIYELRQFPVEHLLVMYPEARMPSDAQTRAPGVPVKFVEEWARDWSRPTQVIYRQTVFLEDTKEPVMSKWHEGEGCNPISIARWSKAGAQGWGRGPLFNCLSSMRKVNYAERALLDHTEWQLMGIWDVEDDGVVNLATVRMEPGGVMPRAPGSAPLQNVSPGGRFDMAAFTLDNGRDIIRKALFSETLGSANQTPKSATEVQQRMTELARAIGSPFGRVLIEWVIPSVVRALRILKDRGLVTMPQIDGKKIDIVATSPLAQGQRFEKIDAIDRWISGLQRAVGPERTILMVDDAVLASETSELYGVSSRLLRSKEGQAAVIEQMQALQQGQPGGAEQPGAEAAPPA